MREDNAQEEWQSRTWRHLTTHDTNSLIMRSTVPQKEKSILPTNNDITTLFTLNPQTRVPSDLLYWYFMLTQRDRCHAVPYNLSKWINIRRKLVNDVIPRFFRMSLVCHCERPPRTISAHGLSFSSKFQLFSSVTLMMCSGFEVKIDTSLTTSYSQPTYPSSAGFH